MSIEAPDKPGIELFNAAVKKLGPGGTLRTFHQPRPELHGETMYDACATPDGAEVCKVILQQKFEVQF